VPGDAAAAAQAAATHAAAGNAHVGSPPVLRFARQQTMAGWLPIAV